VVFPNPSDGVQPLTFYYNPGAGAQAASFKIFTTAFRKIYQDDSLAFSDGQHSYTLDWSKTGIVPANGLYYFVLTIEGGGQPVQKVMKVLLIG
jgi:hypothetical protein